MTSDFAPGQPGGQSGMALGLLSVPDPSRRPGRSRPGESNEQNARRRSADLSTLSVFSTPDVAFTQSLLDVMVDRIDVEAVS
jgi:hypothetical protein